MAFVQSTIPEEQQNQFAQQGQTTSNPLSLVPPQGSGSAGQGGGASTKAAPGVGTPTQFGSGASRLSDYLKANKDQVQGMANDIAGGLTSKYGDVNAQIGKAGQTFGQQVASGYTPTDPSNLQAVKDNPVTAASDPNTLAKFREQMNSTYSGPTSFEGSDPYMNVQKNVQDAVGQADLVKTFPGLSTYLRQNMASNATPGQNTLDTILLQGNMGAYDTVKKAAEPYANLSGYLSDVAKQQTKAIQDAQAAAPAARQAAQTVYSDITNPFISGLNTEYTGATKKAIDYNTMLNSLTGKISNGDLASLTPEEQSLIGFNPKILPLIQQYPQIFATQAQEHPLTPNQFLTAGDQAKVPTPANVLSGDEIAKYQALTALGGGAPTGLNFEMPTAAEPIPGQGSGLPGKLPAYNNMGVLDEIQGAYGNMYDQLKGVGFAGVPAEDQKRIIDYMNQLYGVQTGGQPSSQPTTPPPAPGSEGDLGMGFHWDEGSGTWMPTIPLQPIGGPVSGQPQPGGGGRIWI